MPGRLTSATFELCLRLLLPVAIALIAGWIGVVASAKAQEAPRSHADVLRMFERARQKQQQLQREMRAPVVRRSRRSPAPDQAEPNPPQAEPEPADKLENARVVMVIGDFMADGLAQALADDYAQAPGVKIVDDAKGSSGLVRNDFYDWPKEIGPLMDDAHPAVVVVMLGSNDRQPMSLAGNREPPRSDAWTSEYVKRVEALTKAVTERRIPMIWVGQPAFKYSSMSSDMLAFNDIYQRVVESAHGDFVDIWDGFVDENGAFTMTGPDISGQPVRLRSDDGISLSNAGKSKVAFYVEKPLNKILGNAVSPDIGASGVESAPGGAPDFMLKPSIDRTSPISLADPSIDGASELLGSKIVGKPNAGRTPGERLTIEGIAPASRPGRADDFGGPEISRSALVEKAPFNGVAPKAGTQGAAGTAPPQTTTGATLP